MAQTIIYFNNYEEKMINSILLIEDDDVDYIGFKRNLKKLKISTPIIRAKDGVEAFELLGNIDNTHIKPPYVIVLDINMPRMNGFEFLAKLRKDSRFKNEIVYILTTSDYEKDKATAAALKINGYLIKSDFYKMKDNEVLNTFIKLLS